MDHEEFVTSAHDQVINSPSSGDKATVPSMSGSSILTATNSNPDFHPMEPDYHYPYHSHHEHVNKSDTKSEVKAEVRSEVKEVEVKPTTSGGGHHDEIVYLIP